MQGGKTIGVCRASKRIQVEDREAGRNLDPERIDAGRSVRKKVSPGYRVIGEPVRD